jgi:O-antigen ligase
LYDLNPAYVHNFYLWAWFKLGMAGLLCFVFLIVAAMTGAVRAYRANYAPDTKAFALAAGAVVSAVAIASITSPLFNDEFSAPSIVLLISLGAASLQASAPLRVLPHFGSEMRTITIVHPYDIVRSLSHIQLRRPCDALDLGRSHSYQRA